MINPLFFTAVLFAFALLWVYLAFHASKTIQNTTDYFLAGKQLGIMPITLTLMATQIGGGFLSGIAQESYQTGLYGILYALGICTGFIILGLGIAGRLRELNIGTTAEIFETVYGSTALKKYASLLFIISLWGILVAQIVAFKTIIVGLNITSQWVTILFWLSIIAHTVIGGLKAVVNVDIFKQLFIVGIFSGIFIYSILILGLPSFSIENLAAMQNAFVSPELSWANLLPIFLMPALFCLIEQDLAQCFFAARSRRVAAVSAIYASIFLVCFSLAPVYFGMQTKLLALPVIGQANPLIIYLGFVCNTIIFIFAVIALIAAITSTANSLLFAVSSHIAQDFKLVKSGKKQIIAAQAITLITGLAALITSYAIAPNIIGILTTSYELSVSCLFIPLLAVYLKLPTSKQAALGAMVFGSLGFILFRIYPIGITKEVATLLCSLIGYGGGNFSRRF
jgi:solute:Na+ symporter, SSS family